MALESVTHLDDLEVANPLGTDPRSEGDNHIRNVKKALKTDFPNINGVVAATPADLNLTTGITAGTVLASKFVLVDSSKKVNEWLVDNVTIDGNSITSTSGDLQLKAVSGSNLTIQDDADAAKEVTLVMSSVTSGQDRAWTFPDSDGTFIGAATTETLSNKTIAAGEFTTDLNLNDSVPIRMGTAEDSSISFDGTDLIILTDGAGASGIILDSEDNTVEIKGSGVLQATFDAGGIDLVSGDAYEINDTVVLNATTLGSAVVASSLTSTGALNGGSITSGFGSIVNGASAITTTGTVTGGVVVADNLTLDANAITSTDTNGDITITPHGTGNVVLDGVNWPQADGSANTYLKTNGSAQTSWVAGSPAAAVLTTHGDLVFQNSTPANARLAAGTDGQFLKTQGSGADPIWATVTHTPADNSVTLAKMAPGTDGNIISYDASGDPVAIATGTDGQVLTSTGAGSPPAFEDSAGGVDGITSSANATAMTISSDEEVLTPLQPSFEAYMTSTQSNVTGDGTTFTATGAIWTETRDIGSNFSNGTFTAPIAGWYGFSLLWYISGATTSHTSWANYLVLNTGAIPWNHSNHGPNLIGGNSHIQVRSYMAYLSASDTAHLVFVISGSSKVVDIIGGVNSRFSGRLLG
tara:strand:+ start:281 stop:2197 length:1917 start_codon:yes stop_codon:yes gene_type:complete